MSRGGCLLSQALLLGEMCLLVKQHMSTRFEGGHGLQDGSLQASPAGVVSSRSSRGGAVRGSCAPESCISHLHMASRGVLGSQFGSVLLTPTEGFASRSNEDLCQSLIPRRPVGQREEGTSADVESSTAG